MSSTTFSVRNDQLILNDLNNSIQTNQSLGRTITTLTLATNDLSLIDDSKLYYVCNGAAAMTLTLPSASSYKGRILHFINNSATNAVTSASSNVVQPGGSTSNAILAAGAGNYTTLVCGDSGTWYVVMSN